MNAAGRDRKISLFQGSHTAITLGYAFHAEERSRAVHQPSPGQFAIGVKAAGVAALPQAPAGSGYLFSLVWPMISCAVKLMPQDGKELPTKKLSDWSGKKS